MQTIPSFQPLPPLTPTDRSSSQQTRRRNSRTPHSSSGLRLVPSPIHPANAIHHTASASFPQARHAISKRSILSGLDSNDFWRAAKPNTPEPGVVGDGAKPPLLKRMEDFLSKEMAALKHDWKANPKGPAIEAQLEVYKQCLSLFLQSFKTYAPILSCIFGCYESALHDRWRMEAATVQQATTWEMEYSWLQVSLRVEALVTENEHLSSMLQKEMQRSQQLTELAEQLNSRTASLELGRKEDYKRIMMLVAAVKEAEERASESTHKLHLLKLRMQDIMLGDEDDEAVLNKSTGSLDAGAQKLNAVPRAEHDRLKAEFITARTHIFELERSNAYLRESINTQRLDFEEKLANIRHAITSKKDRSAIADELLKVCDG